MESYIGEEIMTDRDIPFTPFANYGPSELALYFIERQMMEDDPVEFLIAIADDHNNASTLYNIFPHDIVEKARLYVKLLNLLPDLDKFCNIRNSRIRENREESA